MSHPVKPKAQSPNQYELDYDVLGLPHAKAALEVREVAMALRMSEQTVRNLLDEGLLITCSKGARGEGARSHVTIERWSVVAWKLNQWQEQGMDTSRIKQSEIVTIWRVELEKRKCGKAVKSDEI